VPNPERNALELLDDIIRDKAAHISEYVKHPGDFTRNRLLNAETTIKLTMNMQGQSLNAELLDAYPDPDDRMTASAFTQAKDKLTSDVFVDIFKEYNETLTDPKTYDVVDSYRLFAVDGSDFNPPYDPNSAYTVGYSAGHPKKDGSETKPFSQVHGNFLFDIENWSYQDCILQPRKYMDERDAAVNMIKRLDHSYKSISIMDRGYEGFNMFETLNRIPNCYYAIRVKQGECSIREIKNLPDEECDIDMTFTITTNITYYKKHKTENPHLHYVKHSAKHYKKEYSKNSHESKWDFEDMCKVKVRICKFRINDPDTGKEEWEVLITNLNRFEFKLKDMKALYHRRWSIETSFLELKYALGAIQFHSKKDEFIRMELFAHFTMFNVVSRCIKSIEVYQGEGNKHEYAIDFKMACQIVRKLLRFHSKQPYDDYEREMIRYLVPIRDGRHDIRKVVKPKTAVWFVYRIA